jgi:hypothetical protein
VWEDGKFNVNVMHLGETKEFIEVCDIGWGFETELFMNLALFPSNDTSQSKMMS